jgi:uncharacterized protein with HEPN domain
MSLHDDRLYLGHMLDAAEWVRRRVQGVTRAEFDQDRDMQLALTHQLQTVGEAARKVSDAGRLALPQIPWKQITTMRHKIVHDYIHVDLNIVWDTANKHMAPLIDELMKVLGTPPAP